MKPFKSTVRLTILLICLTLIIGTQGILNAQTTYTFTNAGATGRYGPTQTQLNTAYGTSNLNGLVTTTNGIQTWTVPSNGLYRIACYGAAGGGNSYGTGGAAVKMQGEFTLTGGQVIKILVGQMGLTGSDQGGGGGGTYVTTFTNSPLIIAGGGGGRYYYNYSSGSTNMAASLSSTGNYGIYGYYGFSNGAGGTSGSGGAVGPYSSGYAQGSGGGGLTGNGANGYGTSGGLSFVNGGTGGAALGGSYAGHGGFGGGGGSDASYYYGAGGGGGYSGGGAGYYYGCGGGAGSYNNGTNQSNAASASTGHGSVVITVLSGVSILQTTNITCNGQLTAALIASVTGGTGPYTYSWSPGSSTSAYVSGLGAGTYSVWVTDAVSVTYSNYFTVTEPAPISTSVSSQNNVTCNGGTNGSASILVSGGTTPYSYTWSPTGGNGSSATGLTAGNYTVQVKDLYNCATTQTLTLTQPAPMNVVGFATNPVVCSGDQSMLIGAGALTYSWSHGVTNGVMFTPTTTATYTVLGTASNGCTGYGYTSITVNPKPTVVITGTNLICSGIGANFLASGANSYTWSTGANTNGITVYPTVTTNYTVSGTNASGCINSAVKTLTVINSTPAVSANATYPAICFGNSTTLSGNGADTYTWSSGVVNNSAVSPNTTTSYTVTGSNACGTGSSVITITVNALPNITANSTNTGVCLGSTVTLYGGGGVTYTWSSGVTNNSPFFPVNTANYVVTGTDANGCVKTASNTVVVHSLPFITANATSTLICQGNQVTLTGGGGLSYNWSGGAINNVSFSPTVTTSFTVTGTDANGCQNTAAKTVSVITPPALTANATSTSVCTGNSTSLYGSGATTYAWSGGVTNNVAFVPTASTTYTLIGTNSCGSTTTSIGITVNALPVVTASASTNTVCIGVPVTLYGGGANTYTWTGGITNNVSFVPTTSASYTVQGTDANGCINSAAKNIVVNPLPTITTSVSNAIVCYGSTTTFSAFGASTYTWTGGVTNNVAFQPSVTATYSVTGTSSNGCVNTAVRTVTVYQLPTVAAYANATSLCTGNSAILYGSGAHTYSWSNGQTNGQAFYPTTTTNYSVTGTNTLTGCTSTNNANITITVNPLPVITTTASNPVICPGQTTSILASGANNYSWSGGISNGNPFTPMVTTSYYVTGTNTLTGCINIAMQTITVVPRPVITSSISTPAICIGGTVALYAGGADTYTWTGGISNGVPFTPSGTGTYFVTGTNTLTGCTSTNNASKTVTVNQLPTVFANPSNTLVCEGAAVVLSGLGAHTYTWSGGIINGVAFNPTISASYSVTGTHTATGCTNTAVATVTVNPRPNVTLTATDTSICKGTGITITAAGANVYTLTPGLTSGFSFTPQVSQTYTAIGINTVTGCKSTFPASVNIVVNNPPVISSSVSNSTICKGSTVVLTGNGAHTYTWSGGVTNAVPFSPLLTNSYTLTGQDTLTGCTSTNTPVQWVIVTPLPNIWATQSQSISCEYDSVNIFLVAHGGINYQWSTGDTMITIQVNPGVTTTYTLTGMGSNNCTNSATITQYVDPCTGIAKFGQETGLSIYPNPNAGLFQIYSGNNIDLTVINELGQVVKTISVTAGVTQEVNLSGVTNGIYFIIGRDSNKMIRQKIIVSK